MKKSSWLLIWLAIGLAGSWPGAIVGGHVKLAQTGMEFLSVGMDAAAAGISDAATTVNLKSGSLLFNPACMAGLTGQFDVGLTYNQWLSDITYHSVTAAVKPSHGRYGVLGFSLVAVDYGKVEHTIVDNSEQGYQDLGTFTPSALAVGIGYAKSLTDKFSIGGQAKLVTQKLGETLLPIDDSTTIPHKNQADAIAFDFGIIYQTGYKSLAFGMCIRNFSNQIKYADEKFQLPLTFRIGLSMNVLDWIKPELKGQSLLISMDAIHPRSYSKQLSIGLEYGWLDLIRIRTGYSSNNDEYGPTFGFGLSKYRISMDYAYTPFGILDHVQRFTFRFGF